MELYRMRPPCPADYNLHLMAAGRLLFRICYSFKVLAPGILSRRPTTFFPANSLRLDSISIIAEPLPPTYSEHRARLLRQLAAALGIPPKLLRRPTEEGTAADEP